MAFVYECHRFRALHIANMKLFDVEPIGTNDVRDSTIEMASAGYAFPSWRQMILPLLHARLGCATMLNKKEFSVTLQNSARFREGLI